MKDELNRIKLLPEHLIDQIKAGEVIERPSLLLKELLENAIDAGATNINVHIVENGMELISVEDNGHGISYQNLPYAFCRHATSKIERFEDIYSLISFGFRGEALASIASISRVTCISSTKDGEGGKICIDGGRQEVLVKNKSLPLGTSIYIKDLFYNTPARLKFIKSKISEKNAIKRVFNSFVISNPEVEFSIKWDDKEKKIFKPVKQSDLGERISQVILKGKLKGDQLIEICGEYEDYSVRGFISSSGTKGNSYKEQLLFVNKRFFNDYRFHKLIVNSMGKIWANGETGNYVMMVTAPLSQIDVNVHPNKTQIKFFKSAMVFSLISSSIKKILAEKVSLMKSGSEDVLYGKQNAESESADVDKTSMVDFWQPLNEIEVGDGVGIIRFLMNITGRYSILGHSFDCEYLYFLNNVRLFGYFLSVNIKRNFPVNDENITPLLISSPYQVSGLEIDRHFGFMKDMGFEFDRLDHEVIVLRTIPDYLNRLQVPGMLQSVLSYLAKRKETPSMDDFCGFLLGRFEVHTLLVKSQVKLMLESIDIRQILETDIVARLDDSIMGKLLG